MAELSVQIGANIKELIQKLNLTEKELIKLEKLSKKSASGFANEFKKAAGGTDKFKKSTVNATPALQEFSRVIQDAPFGIMGVGNNIQQLTANFGNLSKSAGGSSAALKAMVGSLAGPGGVLLAVSVVTSLLTSYGDELLAAMGSTNELADATKEFVGEAKAEEQQLRTLVSIAQDDANSKGVREEAIKELNKKYKNYLGNLTTETINSQDAKDAVDELSKSLIRQAQIRGISKLIEEKALELAEQEIEAKKDAVKESNKIVAVNKSVNKSYDEQRIAFSTFGKDYKKTQDSLGKQLKKKVVSTSISEETKEIKGEINELSTFLNQKLKEQLNFESLFGGNGDGDVKQLRPKLEIASELKGEGLMPITKYLDYKRDEYGNLVKDRFGKKIKEYVSIDTGVRADFNIPKIDNDIQAFIDAQKRLQTQSQIMGNAVGSTFSALSNQISSELETGSAVVDAFVGSIIGSLSSLLAQMAANALAEKAIASSKIATNQAVATSAAISGGAQSGASSGPLAIFTTPGFIASLVGVVGLAFAGIGSFAKGGFSGDDNLAFLNKNELVLRPFEQAALYNVLKGTGIGGVSNNKSADSGNSLVGEVVLRGQNQVVQLRRAEKRMKRKFNS